LVENAVKYSGNEGEVVVKLNQSNDVIALIVEDKGAGLANEEMSRIFDKFYRVENENTRRTKGTGLGLFIVKYIVENHKGHISVKHNKPNGCIFEASFLKYVEN
jgi:K+-sensing histidine kinase KdpD